MKAKWWVIVVLLVVTITFIIQNSSAVTLKLLVWSINVSHTVLLFITLLIGVVMGVFIGKK